ncbi:MAG: hydrogenobyrinic acid a,c-diamide synthase (glutamine-hydrolyzing) [Deltaproteobacteria bacterium]|nr:hydrogenobyrinic acid a,c-diamide synthase (glutamine-hydrolyzing) [Deltaproteobacteria bacterium]
MNRPCPRLVLAALRGGAGKTTLSVALAVALRQRGLGVVPFKKGPDYIDAAWLSQAAEGPCYNLDTFLIGREQVVRSFSRRARAGSFCLIEGNRGLYDGMTTEGEHSTAELAKLLHAPVILVVDCDKVTRTAAAMVLGCLHLDPAVDIRGVILNRVGGSRHGAIARESVEKICRLPVLGVVPRMGDVNFPERHLGLIPPQEHELVREALTRAGRVAEEHLDLEELIRIAREAPPWESDALPGFVPPKAEVGQPVRIGVIRDAAFQFYYQENIEALADGGARVIEISALKDESLPEIDALYIGGGFPETQAEQLSQNARFRRSLREAAENGLPVYAECGGFIYLGESLKVGDACHPMAGVLPVAFSLEKRPQGHGYTVLEVERENPFFPVGATLKGHEFHYCRILSCGAGEGRMAFRMKRGTGMDGRHDGLIGNQVLAGFSHLHALGAPLWAEAMIGAARRYREDRLGGPAPCFCGQQELARAKKK